MSDSNSLLVTINLVALYVQPLEAHESQTCGGCGIVSIFPTNGSKTSVLIPIDVSMEQG
jgi:hypothetical protein